MQVPGRREPIARIVADAAEDSGSTFHKPGDLPARRLHQPLDRDAEALLGQGVDLLDLGAAKSR